MEMCYGGALVMPSNYAVMNEEEMMYVEGGFKVKKIADYGTPAAFLVSLAKKAGSIAAALVGCSTWYIGHKNKGKGVKVRVHNECPLYPYITVKSR